MKYIKYSPDAADKLRALKRVLVSEYGTRKACKIVRSITNAIRGLVDNEKKGPSVQAMFGLETDYRYIYVMKNYVFYRVEEQHIYIVNIYNEREDFMWQLFGIDTTPQETIDYWQE